MMRSPARHAAPALACAATIVFGAYAMPVRAQGTPEQRTACAPDAVSLCPDTIPDVEKTKTCMKAHIAELSPQCRAVFDAATESQPGPDAGTPPDADPAPKPHKRRVAHGVPLPDDEAPVERPRGVRPPTPDDDQADDDDIDHARNVIAHLCQDEVIDPRTCALTERALSEVR